MCRTAGRRAGRGRARARRRARSTPRGRAAIGGSARSTARRSPSCIPRRDREQPAHRRVEAVVGPEQRDQDPGPGAVHGQAASPGSSRSRRRRRRPGGAPGAGARRGTRRTRPGRARASRPRRVELDHPAVDALGVELGVPGGVERVGQVDALAVARDLDHLRAAVQRAGGRVRRALDDPAEPHRAGLARVRGSVTS